MKLQESDFFNVPCFLTFYGFNFKKKVVISCLIHLGRSYDKNPRFQIHFSSSSSSAAAAANDFLNPYKGNLTDDPLHNNINKECCYYSLLMSRLSAQLWWRLCSAFLRESRSWKKKTLCWRRRKKRWTRRSFARPQEVSFTRHRTCVSEHAEIKEQCLKGWARIVSQHKRGLCAEKGQERSCIEFQRRNAGHLFTCS